MNLSFSRFRQDVELAEQRALFSSAFPENAGLPPESEAFYLRKFGGFPHQPPAYEYIARDPDGMAGYYAAIPLTYQINGEDFLCGMVCDVMTAPRMQGKGVFTKLGAYSLDSLGKDGVDFVTGFPRRPAVIPGHLKVGWKIAFRLPLYLMPLRTNALLASRGVGMLAPIANMLLKATLGILQFFAPGTEGLNVREWDWKEFLADQDYAGFLRQWRAQSRNSLEKNEAYLRWRLGFQGVDYRIVSAHRGDKLIGLSILRSCRPNGVPSLALMDIMTLESEQSVLSVLVDGWRRLAARTGDEVVLTMMSEHHATRRSLWLFGFLRTPAVFFLIIKCLSDRAREKVLPNPSHWDLMWIDCDDL
jgi:hypothetical protein